MAFSKPTFSPIFHSSIPARRIPVIAAANHNIHANETMDKMCNSRFQKFKEARHKLRKVLSEENELSAESLKMVDSLQRLGVEYHFREEIEQVLESNYKMMTSTVNSNRQNDNDLYQVALRFRLLRQHGYYVPADVFKNFKNKEGKFKQELAADIEGLMELHEATHLSIEGEDILDEAQHFSGSLLTASTINLDDYKAGIVLNKLKNPYHKTLPISQVQNNLQNFQETNKSEDVFKQLAKLDFNTLQAFHRDEIFHVSKWWREQPGLANELGLCRGLPLEWLSWPIASLRDPNLSAPRVVLAKAVSIFHVIQRIFRFYGSIDQLSLFVKAVQKWDIDAANDLPDYMKMCLRILYDFTDEIAYKLCQERGYNPKRSLRNAWTKLCNAFLGVAKWEAIGQLPETKDYLKIVNGTSLVHLVLLHIFFLLGENITIKNINLVDNDPPIFSSVASISTLLDGLKLAQVEDRNSKLGSYIKCYMRQYPMSSVQEARIDAMNKISDTWKQLNQQYLSPNPFSSSFIKATVNCARLPPLVHGSDHNLHDLPSIHQNIKSLLCDKIAI